MDKTVETNSLTSVGVFVEFVWILHVTRVGGGLVKLRHLPLLTGWSLTSACLPLPHLQLLDTLCICLLLFDAASIVAGAVVGTGAAAAGFDTDPRCLNGDLLFAAHVIWFTGVSGFAAKP